MDVLLTPELERRIAETIDAGLYGTASDVIQDGLRLLFETLNVRDGQLEKLHADIRLGLDQLDHGRAIPADDVLADVTERLEARRTR